MENAPLTVQEIVDAFSAFIPKISNLVHIKTESDYGAALAFAEALFDMEEQEDELDPIGPLKDMLFMAIERYENTLPEIIEFNRQVASVPCHIHALNLLMDQRDLTREDLPEIGDKILVSRVLNNKRTFTQKAMLALCKRFNLTPNYFYY